MRNDQAAVARGKNSTSQIKKEIGKADNDQGRKTGDLKKAEAEAKRARRPAAGMDEKTRGLSVPNQKK